MAVCRCHCPRRRARRRLTELELRGLAAVRGGWSQFRGRACCSGTAILFGVACLCCSLACRAPAIAGHGWPGVTNGGRSRSLFRHDIELASREASGTGQRDGCDLI